MAEPIVINVVGVASIPKVFFLGCGIKFQWIALDFIVLDWNFIWGRAGWML